MRGRELGGVVEEIRENLHNAPLVGFNSGEPPVEPHFNVVLVAGPLEAPYSVGDDVSYVRLTGFDRERAGLDPRHVEQVVHHLGKAVGLIADRVEQLAGFTRIVESLGEVRPRPPCP